MAEAAAGSSHHGVFTRAIAATGAGGRELIRCLELLEFSAGSSNCCHRPLAKTDIEFRGQPTVVEQLNDGCFAGCDLVFFAASVTHLDPPVGSAQRYLPARQFGGIAARVRRVPARRGRLALWVHSG
jgi:hypothetical protein